MCDIQICFILFYFALCIFSIIYKKPLTNPGSCRFEVSMYFYKIAIVLSLTFRFLVLLIS